MAKTLSTDNYLQTAYASPCGWAQKYHIFSACLWEIANYFLCVLEKTDYIGETIEPDTKRRSYRAVSLAQLPVCWKQQRPLIAYNLTSYLHRSWQCPWRLLNSAKTNKITASQTVWLQFSLGSCWHAEQSQVLKVLKCFVKPRHDKILLLMFNFNKWNMPRHWGPCSSVRPFLSLNDVWSGGNDKLQRLSCYSVSHCVTESSKCREANKADVIFMG